MAKKQFVKITFAVAALAVALSSSKQGVCLAKSVDTFTPEYQVKFLLDSDKVLTDKDTLKSKYQKLLDADDDYEQTQIAYLETKSRDFESQGWLQRIRKKDKKKNVELTYKKRYSVSDTVDDAIKKAISDGFDPADDDLEACVEWGYAKQTLTISRDVKLDKFGKGSTKIIDLEKAIKAAGENMSSIENNWVADNWGKQAIQNAVYAGPLTYKHYEGEYNDVDLDIEVWPIKDASTGKTSCITEASFKVDNLANAKKLRTKLTKKLDKAGILLHEDALKTGTVLDAYLN